MELKIEIPQIEDWKKVNELARQVQEIHVHWRPDLFLNVEEVISQEDFERFVKDKKIIIAKLKNEIIGYMVFNIREIARVTMRYRKQLDIDAICIEEKCRGNGVGTTLLEHAKKIAKENDCTDIFLTVNEENQDAIKLYERLGFKVKNIAYSMKI